jgi:hypothetical protein
MTRTPSRISWSFVVLLAACGSKGDDPAPSESGAGSAKTAATTKADSSGTIAPSASAAPLASSNAPPPRASATPNDLATSFAGDVAPDATARPIFSAGLPGGVIVLVPKPFEAGTGVYGTGYGTWTLDPSKPNQTATTSYVEVREWTTKDLAKLSEVDLRTVSFPTKIDHVKWEAPVEVKLGVNALDALVYRGAGIGFGQKVAWKSYCVSTVIEKKSIVGCGSWDTTFPEREAGVIAVLKSLRTGKAAPTRSGP